MPPRSSLLPIALALVLALAGCGALAGTEPAQTPDTVTPAPLPGEADRVAPGITADGVRNASGLAAAHERQLSGHNYTVHTNNAVVFRNGTVYSRFVTDRQVSPAGRRLLSTTHTGRQPAVSPETDVVAAASWTNETLAATRRQYENGTVSYSVSGPDRVFLYRSTGEFVAETLAETDTRVVSRDNTTDPGTITLAAPGLGREFVGTSRLDSVTRTTSRVVVTERGLIRRVTVRQVGRLHGAPARLNNTISYRAIGSTTVPRPSWVPAAIERHGRAAAHTVSGDE